MANSNKPYDKLKNPDIFFKDKISLVVQAGQEYWDYMCVLPYLASETLNFNSTAAPLQQYSKQKEHGHISLRGLAVSLGPVLV